MLWIGEKLNGAVPSIAAAIAEGDGKMIERIARAQAEAGADFLDVSAATTAEELQALRFLIENAEKGAALPICIDSPDPMAVVQAMAFCSRPGLLNSGSMEGRKADIIFPAMQGNAWRAVALLSDDRGTPDSVEERMAVLERLLECAGQYGIEEERLYVDPLVEALPVSPNAFLKFAARACRESGTSVSACIGRHVKHFLRFAGASAAVWRFSEIGRGSGRGCDHQRSAVEERSGRPRC